MYCFALELFYWFENNSALPLPEDIFPLISVDHAMLWIWMMETKTRKFLFFARFSHVAFYLIVYFVVRQNKLLVSLYFCMNVKWPRGDHVFIIFPSSGYF